MASDERIRAEAGMEMYRCRKRTFVLKGLSKPTNDYGRITHCQISDLSFSPYRLKFSLPLIAMAAYSLSIPSAILIVFPFELIAVLGLKQRLG